MKYIVGVTRTSYASLEFEVEANSKEEAEDKALDMAYNTGWDEDTADYDVEYTEEDEDED